jgi:V8-like Glu-specific endopeptidase
VLVVAAILAACDSAPEDSGVPVVAARDSEPGPMSLALPASPMAQSELDPNTPEDWIGYSIGLEPATRTYLGVLEPGDDDAVPAMLYGPNAEVAEELTEEIEPTANAEGTLVWIEIDSNNNVYRHELPRGDGWRLYEHMKESGHTSGTLPQEMPLEDFESPLGLGNEPQQLPSHSGLSLKSQEHDPLHTWSNGTDSRVRMGVTDGFSATHWPFRTIGHLRTGGISGGCTGTIIGKRTILTSAHCVWDGDSVIGHDFTPRRDSSDDDGPYCTSGTGYCDPETTNYIFMQEWLDDSTCGTQSANASCFAHDIAVVRISEQVGLSSGAMGFGAFNTTATEGYDEIFMRGYPACTPTGDWQYAIPKTPNNTCYWGNLYGHINSQDCNVDQWAYGGCRDDGWYCTFDVSCDGSAGQSGSAFYSYETSLGDTPVALGVYSKAECCPGTAQQCVSSLCTNNSFPNGVTRITPDVASELAYWKSQWGG